MRRIQLWAAFSLLLSGCSGVERPDTDLCVVNVPLKHRKCYNLHRDYDDQGELKPDAKPSFKSAETLDDLNKNICTDPDGFANLKAYIKKLREAGSK